MPKRVLTEAQLVARRESDRRRREKGGLARRAVVNAANRRRNGLKGVGVSREQRYVSRWPDAEQLFSEQQLRRYELCSDAYRQWFDSLDEADITQA